MNGYRKNGKFIPTSKLIQTHRPNTLTKKQIVSLHAPEGTFTHINPRTMQKEEIKLKKVQAFNKGGNEHVLIGKGSDGRPVSKIIS